MGLVMGGFSHFVPDESQPSYSHFVPDNSGPVPPNITDNPKGEGTYAMWNDRGQKLGIPYSQVPAAKQKGYKFDTNPDQSGSLPAVRYVKDAVYSGNKGQPSNASLYWEGLTNPIGSGANQQGVYGGIKQVGGQAIKTMAQPIMHPIDTLGGMAKIAGDAITGGSQAAGEDIIGPIIQQYIQDKQQGGHALALENLAGNLAGQVEGGRAIGGAVSKTVPVVNDIGSAIRTAAIGNPDVPLTRGLGITARTKTGLSSLQASGEASPLDVSLEDAQGARPYGKGAKNLEDLQAKLTDARKEINAPLNTALDAVGGRTIQGPDGPATISDLESQRAQLSAQLRGLQQKDPLAIQTALQKGMGEADLKARYDAIVDAMTPHLDSTGIDSRLIRQQDAQVASIYSKIAGRTTLPEATKPYGFARVGDLAKFGSGSGIDLLAPAKTLGSITKDIAAGRYWSERPTDVNLREGFRLAGPKPDFGTPSPQFIQKPAQLTSGTIELQSPSSPQVGPSSPAINIAPDTRAARLGLLLKAPPIELPGTVEVTPQPPSYAGTTQTRLGRLLTSSTDEQNIPLSEKVDIFPNQLPGSKRSGGTKPTISPKLAEILKRKGR